MTVTVQPDKLTRAAAVLEKIREMDRDVGIYAPGPNDSAARLVSTPLFDAKIMPGFRKTVGRVYEDLLGERTLVAPGWTVFELTVRGRVVLVANAKGSEIILHRYRPGRWETWFGVENGDDEIELDPLTLAFPGTPEWERIQESADYKLPPLRTGPERGEAHRSGFFKRGRRRWKLALS